MAYELSGLKINVRGIVQGVGFRPFIYSLAQEHHLNGWVRNTSNGVEIEVNGLQHNLDAFHIAISRQAPPLSHIDSIVAEACQPDGYATFEILSSEPVEGQFIPVSPDMSICPDCQRELFTHTDHRFRYPFINCTNCGPRFSIIKDIPYDRPKTTMADFPMCHICHEEYYDPSNRRFHAQPTACEDCGPEVIFQGSGLSDVHGEDAIRTARQWIAAGKILAVKGLGGFHLVCDAENEEAVRELRRRKKRSRKPFALMAFDIETIEKHCIVSPSERELLVSKEKPIVILEQRTDSKIACDTAPGQNTIGFMLPYTPLHLLLLEKSTEFPEVLVMTSGNASEEPIVFRDDEVSDILGDLADAYLMHNRPIHMRVDDSVVREFNQERYFIRRARGFAPDPIRVKHELPAILAVGAELKNTFCLTRDRYAFVSHYIGDLDQHQTSQSFEEAIPHYENLFRIEPDFLVCDLHPDYISSLYAVERAERSGLPLYRVQHHHAHMASCLADNNWSSDEPVIGLCLDGTGLGTDGRIWGGELLLGGYRNYQRLSHLEYLPLPGGDLSVNKPARMALACLWKAGIGWDDDLSPVEILNEVETNVLANQLDRNINTIYTSSMGRLFDAVSSLLGICQEATYEGQAAIELEAISDTTEEGLYEFDIREEVFDASPIWKKIIDDMRSGIPVSIIAARFHNGVAQMLLHLCSSIKQQSGCKTVALSGGVWQNKVLLQKTHSLLTRAGFSVLIQRQVPANDGGISLGQAMVVSNLLSS